MPACKNDTKRSYKGDEPSPKGLGYCAHAERVGTVRKGRDGIEWTVSETGAGVRRWTKVVDRFDVLIRAVEPWYTKLANGALLVIRGGGEFQLLEAKQKTAAARSAAMRRAHAALGSDPSVRAIVWTSVSRDVLKSFVRRVLNRAPSPLLRRFTEASLAVTARELFPAYFVKTDCGGLPGVPCGDKDYTFRGDPL